MIKLIGLIVLLSPCICTDVRKRELPVIYIGTFGLLSVIANLLFQWTEPLDMLLGAGVGLILFAGSFFSKGAIGAGDGILMAVIGIWCGAILAIPILMIAVLSAAVIGGITAFRRRQNWKLQLPFAPFLGFAGVVQCVIGMVCK